MDEQQAHGGGEVRKILTSWAEAVKSATPQDEHITCLKEAGNLHSQDGKARNILSNVLKLLKNDKRIPLLHLLYDALTARSGIETEQGDAESDAETDDDVENVSRHSNDELDNLPVNPDEKWTFKNTYKLAKYHLEDMIDNPTRQSFQNYGIDGISRDEDWLTVLHIATELWMVNNLKHCKLVVSSGVFTKEAGNLFTRYKTLSDLLSTDKSHLVFLQEKDCYDLMESLLNMGNNSDLMKEHLLNISKPLTVTTCP